MIEKRKFCSFFITLFIFLIEFVSCAADTKQDIDSLIPSPSITLGIQNSDISSPASAPFITSEETEPAPAPNLDMLEKKPSTEQPSENTAINDYLLKNKKKQIKEQSFDIILDEFGSVSFLSCIPDYSKEQNFREDASFYLAEDEIIYQFPFVYTNNTAQYWIETVSYVSFTDINQDSLNDVIIGADYITGAGPSGVIPFTLVRIFRNTGGDFVYEKELSEEINKNRDYISANIEDVLDYINRNNCF